MSGIYSAEFDGADSKIDCGSDFIGTKAVMVCGWIKLYSFGEGSATDSGHFIDNGAFKVFFHGTDTRLRMQSNAIDAYSAIGSIILNKWIFFAITRQSGTNGVANIYLADVNTPPALSFNADQSSGTPTAGTNVIIGNETGQTKTFDGLIPELRIEEFGSYDEDVLLRGITQAWSESRSDYSG